MYFQLVEVKAKAVSFNSLVSDVLRWLTSRFLIAIGASSVQDWWGTIELNVKGSYLVQR